MPRKNVNKGILKVPDATNLFNAIKMVLIYKQAERRAAAAFGIVSTTLRRHLDIVKKHFLTLEGVTDDDLLAFIEENLRLGQSVFAANQEKVLVRYIISCPKMNYGLSMNSIRSLAYIFAVKIGRKFPASWAEPKMATKDWYYGFMRRHPNLKLCKPQPTSAARSKGFCKEAVYEFFSKLQEAIAKAPAIFDPNRVWNMDKTELPTVTTNVVKVVAEKGAVVGQCSSAERENNVTMAVAVSAAGNTIPPMFLFPGTKMKSAFLDNAPPGSIGCANVSGWMDSDHFIVYMKHFIKHTSAAKTNPLLLIMDNHKIHMSIEVVDLCIANGIEVVTLPPHCSGKMQPLDVSVFGPFKRAFSENCMEWCQSHRVLKIHQIPGLADKAMKQAVTRLNIISGFEATGIYPLNASIFSDNDFLAENISGENLLAEDPPTAEDVLNMLVSFDKTDAVSNKEVTISEGDSICGLLDEASTSASASTSSLRPTLVDIGPIEFGAATPKSNRGRKAMKSVISTSPQKRSERLEAARKSAERKKRSTSQKPTCKKAKKQRLSQEPSNEE